MPGGRLEIRPDDGEQLLENVLVVVLVPLSGQVAIGVRQLREEIVGLVANSGTRLFPSRLAKGPDAIDRYLSQPGTKGTIAAVLERRQLTEKDDEDFLTQVLDLVAESRNPPQPAANQRQVDVLQPAPLGGVRLGRAEAVKQAKGGCVHEGP